MAQYKPSMFNRIIIENDNMILFNARTGSNGIAKVSKQKQDEVVSLLNTKRLSYIENDTFQKLIDYKFIVPYDYDEKAIRDLYITTYIANPQLHLVVHTSRDCNFRCAYCYMNFEHKCIEEDVQLGIVNFVKKNIHQYNSVHISWFGGEPLLEMSAIERISSEIMQICAKAKKPYTASITTNGYLLTPKNIKILLDSKVRNFFVTIDGCKELHDSQRFLCDGSPTFQRIIENLLYIKHNIKTMALGIAIRTNMTKKHISTLDTYYAYFNELFGDDNRFSLYVKQVSDYGGERVKALKTEMLDDMSCIYESMPRYNEKLGFLWNKNDLNIGSSCCPSRRLNKYTIGCDGSIHKCDEDIRGFSIGHLCADGTMVMRDDLYAKWVTTPIKQECDDCFFSINCFMETCPKTRIFRNKLECDVIFDEIDALIRWVANMGKVIVI